MPTNLITLKTSEEYMSGYLPIYRPIYPLFLAKSVAYDADVGNVSFRKVTAIGDIRQKRILPKDTEIKQINVTDTRKSFAKYFFANQYTISDLQDQEGTEDVIQQVLDEHQLQADELLMLGDGTSTANILNNGLYLSNDPNYTLKSSTAIASGDGRLADFHNKVVASANQADQVAGRKVILFYGSDIIPLFNSVYGATTRAWKAVLSEVLGGDYSFVKIPEAATPSGANGWIVANMDQVKLHYTLFPELADQGYNNEKGYYWFNFRMGSLMLEVTQKDGVIRQPATLA